MKWKFFEWTCTKCGNVYRSKTGKSLGICLDCNRDEEGER